MIVAFDLDDTLYRELDYVESGFRAVARSVAGLYPIDDTEAYDLLIESMETHGRGRQFDDLLRSVNGFTVRRRNALIQVYRQHLPAIELPASSRSVLERLADRGHRLFIVTDGNHQVQNRKVVALGVRDLVEHAYLTGRYGAEATKPGTKVFELILARTGATTADLVYIGDNPRKDFVGVRSLGGRTVRVLSGPYATEEAAPGHDAEVTVNSLTEVLPVIEMFSS